jgi:hypothetical protein
VTQDLLEELAETPARLNRAWRRIPRSLWGWRPESWEGFPGERLTALEHLCHLRDLEIDGYQIRFARTASEDCPDLASIDGEALARQRDYLSDDPASVLDEFGQARRTTVALLRSVPESVWVRSATFAEHGRVTFRTLAFLLLSHDQQHLSCLSWLTARFPL